MAPGFSVEPTRLIGLADELQAVAGELRQAVSEFALAASPEPGLFGVLGPAPAAAARYGAMVRQAKDGLQAAAAALDDDVAAGLRATVAGYLASDTASVIR